MVEHVEVEVKASHQTLDGARVEVHADETGLHFGNLRQGPAFFHARDADDATDLQALFLGHLVGEVFARKLAAVGIQIQRLEFLAVEHHDLKGLVRELRDNGRFQIVRGLGLVQRQTNRVVAGLFVADVDAAARTTVTVLAVVGDQVLAHGFPGG